MTLDTGTITTIIIPLLTLLGGYFGIPKAVTNIGRQIQKQRIKSKAEKLSKELGALPPGKRDRISISREIDEILDELDALLWRAKGIIDNKEFLQKQLNDIVRELYGVVQKGIDTNMQIQNLAAKFGDSFEFAAESWVNVAIANMNLYCWDAISTFRKYSLEACERAINKKPNYGDPRAVKLIIYMIDYARGKQINNDDIQNMIKEINSGDDERVSHDTYAYLAKCVTKGSKEWCKYIDLLSNLFPKEMETMKNRYNRYEKRVSP